MMRKRGEPIKGVLPGHLVEPHEGHALARHHVAVVELRQHEVLHFRGSQHDGRAIRRLGRESFQARFRTSDDAVFNIAWRSVRKRLDGLYENIDLRHGTEVRQKGSIKGGHVVLEKEEEGNVIADQSAMALRTQHRGSMIDN